MGSSPGSGWANDGHSETCPEATPEATPNVLPSSQRNTRDMSQSDHLVLDNLPDQGHSPSIAQFGLAASSRKCLDGSKLLPFKNDVSHCVVGSLNAAEMFW